MGEMIIMMTTNPRMTVELKANERSCINKLNIVKDFSMVTIIGQIKPQGILKSKNNTLH